MSRFGARLGRLERALGPARCPACAYRQIETIEVEEGEPEPPAPPCGRCGGHPEHIWRIVIVRPAGADGAAEGAGGANTPM